MTRSLKSALRFRPEGLTRYRTAVVVVALLVLTAGCSGFIGGDSPDADDAAPLDDIPAEADGVLHFQTGVLTDSTTETLMDGLLERDAAEETDAAIDAPESWEEILEEAEAESDIDIDDIHSATMFGSGDAIEDQEEYSGVILQTSLDWEDFESAADEEVETDDVEEDTYNGVTVYIEEDEFSEFDTWVADFEDGTFAFGPEPVVRDVIDTRQGDAEGIDDELRSTFEDATDGYLTAAVTLTEDQSSAASDAAAKEAGIGEMFIPETEAMSMTYHTEGEQMNVEMDFVLQSTDEAETFTSFIEPIIEPPGADDSPSPEEQPFEWLVDSVTLDSENERISVSFAATPEDLLAFFDALDDPALMDDGFASHSGAVSTAD